MGDGVEAMMAATVVVGAAEAVVAVATGKVGLEGIS